MERKNKIAHFIYIPFTGLGLYNGYRGTRWLRNRIKIFKHFVLPSLRQNMPKNAVLWISWRPEDRGNELVNELRREIGRFHDLRVIFTFGGVCFWDDKYSDTEAGTRLLNALNYSLPELSPYVRNADTIWMTIQPSDDVYLEFPKGNEGWSKGYIMNYATGKMAEYNPTTTPPFYTIEFPVKTFLSPVAHYRYTGPYKSHEYVKDFIPMKYLNKRGFIVGVHGENISTGWDIPFKGKVLPTMEEEEVCTKAGILFQLPLKLSRGWRRTLFYKLPHNVRRKLRYIFGERFYAKIHNYVTNH